MNKNLLLSSALKVAFSLVGAVLLTSCGLENASESGVSSTRACLSWANPKVDPTLKPISGGHADQQSVAEGLTLLGVDGKPSTQFDCTKPTLVYVTGYSPQGVGEFFREPENWTKQYNILMFRWHRLGFDAGSPPLKALHSTHEASNRLKPQLEGLLRQLKEKGYSHEVRTVAHSMGGIVVSKTLTSLDAKLSPMVKRLELLDPAFPFYDRRPTFWNDMRSQLISIRDSGKKVVVYSSVRSEQSASKLKEIVNVQSMAAEWLNGVDSERHTKIREYYFSSLARPGGRVANPGSGVQVPFSASFPTHAIPKGPVHLLQTGGFSTVEITDDVYTLTR